MPVATKRIFVVLLVLSFTLAINAQNIQPKPADGGDPEDTSAPRAAEPATEPEKKISYKLPRGRREIEVVPAFAPMQPTFLSGVKEYDTAGRSFGMFSLRFTRTIGSKNNITYQYYFEVTPLAVALNNEAKNPKFVSAAETPNESPTVRRTAFGAGFQPINFRFIFKRSSRIKPFVQVGAGIMLFNRKMPVADSTNFNFTGDFGGGIYLITDRERQNRAMIFGYRYFHISNFHLSKVNPGYNANIFYVAYSFSRR